MARPQLPAPSPDQNAEEEDVDDSLTQALARVDGRVKVSVTRKVTDIIDRNPEQTLSILRGWLHSGGITD